MSNLSDTTCWPTFDPCPRDECGGIVATDGERLWCMTCDWTDAPDLFNDTDTDR